MLVRGVWRDARILRNEYGKTARKAEEREYFILMFLYHSVSSLQVMFPARMGPEHFASPRAMTFRFC